MICIPRSKREFVGIENLVFKFIPFFSFAILKAMALSKNRFGEIVNETSLDKGILHKYLFTIGDLHVIEKEMPATEKNPLKSRKGQFRIHDQFIKF